MIDKQINQLPIISQLNGNELFPLWGGASKATSIYKLRNYVLDNLTVKAGDNINKTGNPQVKIENNEITFDYLKGEKGDSAYKQALDAGFDGTEDEFKLALKNIKEQVVVDVEQIEDSEDIKVRENKLYIVEEAKKALFDDMWVSIGGTKLDNGKYRIGDENKELNLEEALLRYERDGFIKIWNDRCDFGGIFVFGKYDPDNAPDPNKPFLCNELWFTYKEAVAIYNASGAKYGTLQPYNHTYPNVKTIIPTCTYGSENFNGFLSYFSSLVNVAFINGYRYGNNKYCGVGFSNFSLYGCSNIERVLNPIIPMSNLNYDSFSCSKLYELKLYLSNNNCKSIDFRNLPKWSYESIQYTITYKTSTVTVTITVHPDVYAKLTGDETNEAYNNLTDEEKAAWTALLGQALDKNITFATV